MSDLREIKVKIPKSISEKEAKLFLAIQLYSEGKVTLQQAANVADIHIWDFLYELGKRKVSFTNILLGELEEELSENS
ncbi:MAG: UPF0175 family protein [Candidatus Odinarchaeota archaeon]|nr:UPF0175 family protein [Candidatus Odinarchaeota archaeon]